MKKNGVVAGIVFAVLLFLASLFFGLFWKSGQSRVSLPYSYYFVVQDCEEATSAAVVGQVYYSGGAGYYMEQKGERAVAIACYYKESSANQIKERLALRGIETKILKLSPSEFDSSAAKEKVISNAETLDACARLLYDTANGLERTSLTQEEGRSAVRGVVQSLKGLCTQNGEGAFARWNAQLRSAVKKGTEIAEGIVFAKDLRYLQVELCLDIVNMGEYFG